jgi:hypothetical protein
MYINCVVFHCGFCTYCTNSVVLHCDICTYCSNSVVLHYDLVHMKRTRYGPHDDDNLYLLT